MQLELLAFGQKMPSWLQEGIQTYQKRLTKPYQINITELPLLKRPKSGDISQLRQKESDLMQNAISSRAHIIALEIDGKQFSSEKMAQRLQKLEQHTSHIQFLIGGPEGLNPTCTALAHEKWSLSELTMAHPLVRLFLVETLYRCWAINQNHPYHK